MGVPYWSHCEVVALVPVECCVCVRLWYFADLLCRELKDDGRIEEWISRLRECKE